MSASQTRPNAGMTLVELLVVVAILGLLSVVVLPNLAGKEGTRALRLAAGNVSAQFAKSQSLSISRKSTYGVWLDSLPNNPAACIDLYFSDVPDPYRGDTFDAKFMVAPAASATSGTLTATSNSGPAVCVLSLTSTAFGNFTNPGNLVQFNDCGPFYDFLLSGTWTARLRTTTSQTPANTLWPAPPPAAHRFAIYRVPTRAGQPLTLPAGTAIDLAWSGVVSQRFGQLPLNGDAGLISDPDYAFAAPPGANPPTITALFDATGAFAEICYLANSPTPAQTSRLSTTGPLYLLIGRVDRCGLPYNPAPTESNPGANWQYADSFWIAIDPKTGIIKTAEVVPNSATARDSQRFIRAGLATGNL
jgi:prepilin-type N-terminal cleavage/methylation domain-containing protein